MAKVEPGFATDVLVGHTSRGDKPLPVRVTFDDGRLWRVHVGDAYVSVGGVAHAYAIALAWVVGEAIVFYEQPKKDGAK